VCTGRPASGGTSFAALSRLGGTSWVRVRSKDPLPDSFASRGWLRTPLIRRGPEEKGKPSPTDGASARSTMTRPAWPQGAQALGPD
jgi:hypothetical protein